MLSALGIGSSDSLFDEIPQTLRAKNLNLPAGLNEQAMLHYFRQRVRKDGYDLSFLGAGAYEHHIPAAVWELAGRGELMTAYTPYQAEASQGSLQIIYEYQSMMCQLTGMEVANASVYDGASALAEAILMAVRINERHTNKKVLCLGAVHPHYLETARTLTQAQDIVIEHQGWQADSGRAELPQKGEYAAVVVQQPNFFGVLESVNSIADWAHRQKALLVALVNPTSLALLRPPGEWGEKGADIVVGEGQPLGIPLSGGGPYLGFMCTRKSMVRQLPGRIVGRTVDRENNSGFTLVLQTREQHIRRSKATSNICTNQGLLAAAAAIYLSLLGPEGLKKTALACHQNTRWLRDRLSTIPSVKPRFSSAFFHECVLEFDRDAEGIHRAVSDQGILAGLPLGGYYPKLKNSLLLCATETRSTEDMERLAKVLEQVISC